MTPVTTAGERLKQTIDEHPEPGRVPDFDVRLGDFGASSVDAVAFFKVVNQESDLGFSPEDCLQFKTLRDLATFVDARAA